MKSSTSRSSRLTAIAMFTTIFGCDRSGNGSGAADSGTASDSSASDSGQADDLGQDSGSADDTGWSGSQPSWSAEDVQEYMNIAFAGGLPDMVVLRDVFLDLMSQGDEECPGSADTIDYPPVPLTGCTSESGYTFAGIGKLSASSEGEVGSGNASVLFQTDIADFQIVEPSGDAFSAGGSIQFTWIESATTLHTISTRVLGSWSYPPHEKAWLREGFSAYLSTAIVRGTSGNSTLISGTYDTNGLSFWYDELTFDDTLCLDPVPTSGAVWIRQDYLGWMRMTVDDSCSGCADLIWGLSSSEQDDDEGLWVGEVCPDWGQLIADAAKHTDGEAL